MFSQFIGDTRGQPIGIGRYFLSLLVGAILVMAVLTPVATPLLEGSMEATDHQQTNQATGWFQEVVDYTPVIMLFVATFGLIILAVNQRTRI